MVFRLQKKRLSLTKSHSSCSQKIIKLFSWRFLEIKDIKRINSLLSPWNQKILGFLIENTFLSGHLWVSVSLFCKLELIKQLTEFPIFLLIESSAWISTYGVCFNEKRFTDVVICRIKNQGEAKFWGNRC